MPFGSWRGDPPLPKRIRPRASTDAAVHFENSCSGESRSPVGSAVRNTAQHPPSAVVCPQGRSAAGPIHSHATPSGPFCLQIGNRPLQCDFATYSPYFRPWTQFRKSLISFAKWTKISSGCFFFLVLSLCGVLFCFKERGDGRERNVDGLSLLRTLTRELTKKPRHVPKPGTEQATSRSAGQCPTNWATLARGSRLQFLISKTTWRNRA